MVTRNVRVAAWLMFIIVWLMLLAGSYIFSKKPSLCSPITILPTSIDSSGCYQLREDLELKDLSGTAILIRASNVRLDLGGHRILGPSNPHGRGVGIAAYGVRDVVVENGIITGFLYGIRAEGWKSRITDRFSLRKVFLTNNTFIGAVIKGRHTVVEDITVENTGGTLFYPNALAIGLDVAGAQCRIRRNRILGIHPVGTGEGVGISLSSDVQGCEIEENVLKNTARSGESKTIGVRLKGPVHDVKILNNQIDGFIHPSFYS